MVQKQVAKRRGRPPAYDSEKALGQALDAFWTTGFSATSLDDLAAATGMNRPSLYGAFGDKRALFMKALMAYRGRAEAELALLIGHGAGTRETLVTIYAAALKLYAEGGDSARGCFLTGAAIVTAGSDRDVGEAVLDGFQAFDRMFVELFRRGQEAGEIGMGADPDSLGLMASALLHTLSVRTRAGASRADLVRAAAKGVDTLLRAAL